MGKKKCNMEALQNSYRDAFERAFQEGGRLINKQYAPHAGRALRNGDGKLMATYRKNKKLLEY